VGRGLIPFEVEMIDQTEFRDDARVRTLEAEVRAMRQQVELRDKLLHDLNQRLLQLERGETGSWSRGPIEMRELRTENNDFRHLVNTVLATKMFRWTVPARRLHGRVHQRLRGSA
jgi:hypothetical protein